MKTNTGIEQGGLVFRNWKKRGILNCGGNTILDRQ
jgi:hypothetical protein